MKIMILYITFMAQNEMNGDATRRALVGLRKALGKTQQAFAVEFLKVAVATVARYETSNPPRGDVLLRLSEIAAEHGEFSLKDEFLYLYLDDVLQKVKGNMFVVPETADNEPHGFLLLRLDNQKQVDDAIALLRKRRGPIEDGTGPIRDMMDAALSGRRGIPKGKK